MSSYRTGPNYIKRLEVSTEYERLTLRTPISVPGIYWALILSTFISLPITGFLDYYHLYHEPEDAIFVLSIVATVFGTTILGTLLYLLIAHLLRRRIVLDRERNLLIIRNRGICPLNELDHIEKVQGLIYWGSLAFVLRNGRKIYFLNHPDAHSSANILAEKLADYLRVPFKDYGKGNYYQILSLRIEGDRLTMNPPNERLANWITNIAWVLLFAGALYFAWVIFPRQTGHEMESGRGLGLLLFGIASCIHYLATRIFHRRIVLDRLQNRLTMGFRRVGALNEIVHIGLHVKQKEKYRFLLAFFLTGGRQVPIISYDSYPPTTVEVANTLSHFLHVPVVDYHDRAVVEKLEHERQTSRPA